MTQTDPILTAVRDALQEFRRGHPTAVSADAFRENPGIVRVRVIDPRYESMSRLDQHRELWYYLRNQVGSDAMQEVYEVLTISPRETDLYVNQIFEEDMAAQTAGATP